MLPKNLSHSEYLRHIATQLGWIDAPKKKNFCPGIYTVPQYLKNHPLVDKDGPIEITSMGPEEFRLKGVSVLQNKVVIKQPGRIIYADKVYVFRDPKTGKINKVAVRGHVRIYQQAALLVSDEGIVTFYPRTITIKNIAFHYYNKGGDIKALNDPYDAWGTATLAAQNSQKVITLKHATYSTCPPKSPMWEFSTSTLVLDHPNNIGRAYNMLFRIKSVPVFYFPYFTYPLSSKRKSGFLFPVIGNVNFETLGSDPGSFIGFPFYWNLAPNYDALITPQYYGQRGFRLVTSARYLTKASAGFAEISFLPNDQLFATFRTNTFNTYSDTSLYDPAVYNPYLNQLLADTNFRGMLIAQNSSDYAERFFMRYYFNLVTDAYYLNDVSPLSLTINPNTNQLLNMLQLQYNSNHWDSSFYIQGYQTLHLITQISGQSQALDQYRRVPDLAAYGYYPINSLLDFEVYNEYSNFDYYSEFFNTPRPRGSRFHLRPSVSLNLENSSAYFKPQLWYDITSYALGNDVPGISNTATRTLPIANIDMGLHLVRHFNFGDHTYNQTFEPRLFYLYVPFTNQDSLPNFDTIQLPFFFDQLYALNIFQGYDRIQNANQISLGLSSDIIRDQDGHRFFNANLGSSYYISQPKVCLIPGCQIITSDFSPLIASFTLYPNLRWSLNSSVAWDPNLNLINNASFGMGYNQDGHKVINVSYLYVHTNPFANSTFTPASTLDTNGNNPADYANSSSFLIVNFTWPLNSQIRTLGYVGYDLRLKRVDTMFAGIQYDSCCWAIRFIIKRLFTEATLNQNNLLNNLFSMSYFVELTFKGLGSFGTGSDTLVQGIVPGYKT